MKELQLGIEYTYKQICEILGIKYYSGNNRAKIKQIKAIELAYEFYHPINSKTHKEKKSYVFTKKLRDIDLSDQRKNNGGFSRYDEFFQPLLLHIESGEYTISKLFEQVFCYQWDKKYIKYWEYKPSSDRRASKEQTEIVKYLYNNFKSNLISQMQKLSNNDDYCFYCNKGYRLWDCGEYIAFNEGLSLFDGKEEIEIYNEDTNSFVKKEITSLDIELYEQELKEKYIQENKIDGKLTNNQRTELYEIQHNTENVNKAFGYDCYCTIFNISNNSKCDIDNEFSGEFTYFRQNLKLQFIENLTKRINEFNYDMYDYKNKKHTGIIRYKYKNDTLVQELLKNMEENN